MDRHNTKRPRDSSSSSSSSSSSPLEIIGNGEKRQHVGQNQALSPPAGRLFDNFDYLSFDVFDFPWLKDSLIYSKSDDWKFEDVFFTSFNNGAAGGSSTADATTLTIGTTFTDLSGQLMWCNLPDPWEEEYEARAAAPSPSPSPPPLDGGGQAGEGMDCIWSSLLNQPLQQGSSAL